MAGFINKKVFQLLTRLGWRETMPLNDELTSVCHNPLFIPFPENDLQFSGSIENLTAMFNQQSFLLAGRLLRQSLLNPGSVAVNKVFYFGLRRIQRNPDDKLAGLNIECQSLSLAALNFKAERL